MPSQTSDSRRDKSRISSFENMLWLKSLVVYFFALSICVFWTTAQTADSKRPNKGHRNVSGSGSPSAEYVPGELIVKFRDEASATTVAAANSLAGGHALKIFSIGTHRVHHLKLNPAVLVEDAVAKYRQSPAVEYAEPNYVHKASMIPNDPAFPLLWGLHNNGQSVNGTAGAVGADIEAPNAWDITTGSPNTVIGVVDTGIAYDHPDLGPNMWINPGEISNDGIDNDGNGFIDDVNGYDFLSNDPDPMEPIFFPGGNAGHGTHVAGTIAAVGNNALGITGVLHTTRLMALKAGDVNGIFTTVAILQAEDYARTKGARALNESFGRSGGPCSQAEYDMLSLLNAGGIMVLIAAGNENANNDVNPSYPAQYSVATACGPGLPNVIAVAAIDQSGNRAGFSNFGATSVQIAAPGINIYSARPTVDYGFSLFHNYDSNPSALGYTFSGTNNSWGFTNTVSASPPASLSDSPLNNYLNNTNSFAASPVFSTAGQRGCRLVSDLRLATESGFDGVVFDVSNDGGTTWSSANSVSGTTGGIFINVPFGDIPDRSVNTRFRFNFISDGSVVDDGAYFDNVGVRCTLGSPSGATDYQFLQGTSMATPHVTGVVGLVLAANPGLSVAQIRDAILNTGTPVATLNGITSTGRRLNARNAVVSVVDNFTVTVSMAGTGSGTVTSNPSGIHCGATCSRSFASPATITLSAVPSSGSTFSGWSSGGCAGAGSCVVNVSSNVTATFDEVPPSTNNNNPSNDAGGGGGCTLAQAGKTDGAIPMMFVITLALFVWRIQRRSDHRSIGVDKR